MSGVDFYIGIVYIMKDDKNGKRNTSLQPIQVKQEKEDPKLRRLSDNDIIQGFRYLLRKDINEK